MPNLASVISITYFYILTDAADGEADVVDHETVDPWFVRQVAQHDAAHSVGYSYNGQQLTGLIFGQFLIFRHRLQEHHPIELFTFFSSTYQLNKPIK